MYLLHIWTMPDFLWHFNGMSKVFLYFRKLYSDILEENFASEIVNYIERKKVEIHSLPIEQRSRDRVKNMIFLCWPIDRNLQRFHWEKRIAKTVKILLRKVTARIRRLFEQRKSYYTVTESEVKNVYRTSAV